MNYRNWILFSILMISVFALQAQDKKPIQLSDLTKIVSVSNPEITPDGQQVLFVKNYMEAEKDGKFDYKRQLILMNLNHPELTKVLNSPTYEISNFTLSPDGKKLAFTKSWEGKSQIWVLPMDGGESQVLTDEKDGASSPVWSPDGSKILFSFSVPLWAMEGTPPWENPRPGRSYGDEPNYEAINAGKAKEDLKPNMDGSVEELRAWLAKNAAKNDPRVIDRLNFLGERGLSTDISFRHLGVYDLKTGTSETLTSGYQSFGAAAWAPDGSYVLATSVESDQHPDLNRELNSSIYRINLADHAVSKLIGSDDYRYNGATFSPDGKWIMISGQKTDEDRNFNQSLIGVAKPDGSGIKWLTESLDRRVGGAKWSDDSRSIYFAGANKGGVTLYKAEVSNGKVSPIITGPVGVGDFDIQGSQLVYSLTQVSNPNELYKADLNGKSAQQLTQYNEAWLADRWISQPKAHQFSHDGFEVDYWVMPPYGLKEGNKYPTLLEMHGGPTAMWGPGESSMWHEFQVLAGKGYGIVYANPRGSGGYGKEFQKGNYKDWGDGPAKDVLTALDKAGEAYEWINEDQLVLTGGSYAGYLTAWIVGHDHRFKAAVTQRGVYELTFFMGEGNAWRLVPNYFGYPWEEGAKEILDYNSPQTYVQNIETPLLIFHGDNDLRTGVRQSELLYKSLKIMDKPVEYIRYPREGHELSRSGEINHRFDRIGRIVEFFERYVTHPN
ncbi:S9 family peptidase [Algoriphagus halophilus]|uniref:Dipeptidyl aminopeptidase/acylaminoacyl peptidase n=1 Tax=Algoriphagus halophilus TaxID=226505 RepID=A0A1N6DRM7_9BACT|nr:S9 family peptidase [Algoriphagus halophilus]SIN73442.1 Dipeptidyl aminopeptidase/acylaminoacyl peptidase [Algoriphagus halophilus]